jgi:membrane protein
MNTSKLSTEESKTPWRLGGLSLGMLARNVVEEIQANNLLGRASELAFDFLFALFPLLLVLLAVFGLFASRSVELQRNLLFYFADFLPSAAFELVNKTIVELTVNASGGKLTSGIVFSLWFASGGVASMISALNLIYRVRESRSWFRVRATAVVLTLLISVLLLAALLIVLMSGSAVDWLAIKFQIEPMIVVVWKIFQWPAALLFVVTSYSLIYSGGPDWKKMRQWTWLSPGSVFGALLWFLASVGFRIYLHFLNTYSASYGSLGALMILLAWLYVTAFAFLVGGAINAEIERATN